MAGWKRDANKCHCLNCKAVYDPYKDDYGNCKDCNLKEARELAKVYTRSGNKTRHNRLSSTLTSEQKEEIRKWYFDNRENFDSKEEAKFVYRRRFKINVFQSLFDSITHGRFAKKYDIKYAKRTNTKQSRSNNY